MTFEMQYDAARGTATFVAATSFTDSHAVTVEVADRQQAAEQFAAFKSLYRRA